MFTREQFEKWRIKWAKKLYGDKSLQNEALDVLVKADTYNWIHQTNWFGEPILNLAQDMFAIQEIIYKTKPEYIIEVGVAWGGATLFYSTIMEMLGGKKVIGIDIYIPPDLKKRIFSIKKLSKRIKYIEGSSIDRETIHSLKKIIGTTKKNLIILDSNHTHDHVLKELNIYSEFLEKGFYLICGDTIIENIPKQTHRDRKWGPGDNPMTALQEFMKTNKNFKNDYHLEQKLLFTCNPSGFLKKIR